jgi:ABC-2 type transport system ATP-binding protein
MVKIENLSKSFEKTEAVVDLSFEVRAGEVLGLLGPNGAGKTTTLRSIAGVLKPDKGSITLGGFDLSKSPIEAKALLAYLPDQPSFFDNLTCWDHIRFVASVFKVSDYEKKGTALFDRFELAEKKNALPSELSKGMRQRLGLICSLLHSPKVILFDEPMTGLDPRGIRTLNEVIQEESRRGTAIVLSSHLLSILEEVCTKVLVVDHGKSRLYGTLEEVRSKSGELKGNASLEEMFFYATKKDAA